MNNELLLPQRLKALRKERKLSQKSLAKDLSRFMKLDKDISPSAMCSWENGEKHPTYTTLLAFSEYYDVSTDYLLGIASKRIDRCIIKVTQEQLDLYYDKKPVYLEFPDNAFPNQWGIYSKDDNCFFCAGRCISNTPSVNYYSAPPQSVYVRDVVHVPLTLEEAKEYETVWIEYDNPNTDLKAKFTDWYRVQKNYSIFITANGFALPFSGIDVSYRVFKNRPISQ